MAETWTILKVLQWTTDYFRRQGIEQPRADAEVLLAHVLGVERIRLYLDYDRPLSSLELTRYREAVQRRATREPIQHITRKQEFWSLDFEVTSSVLIPRPETELLVEKAMDVLKGQPHARVLDLGTGSGAIAVALAHELPHITMVAVDKSPAALAVARRNAIRHNVQERIWFAAMDYFSAFALNLPPFDLMVSNPPYIGDTEFETLSAEVARYEPQLALRGGGPEGLDTIRQILEEAFFYLNPGGALLMEIGRGQAEILQETLARDKRIEHYAFIEDYSRILRILHIRKAKG